MGITEKIRELRLETGISVMLCKKALEESSGDMEKAREILRQESFKAAQKKSERQARAGLVDSYLHSNKQIGVLVEVRSETDFVARTKEFQEFSHDIAMQIAASNPQDIEALLAEPFIKNPSLAVNDYLKEAIQKFGEKIEIVRFSRFEI